MAVPPQRVHQYTSHGHWDSVSWDRLKLEQTDMVFFAVLLRAIIIGLAASASVKKRWNNGSIAAVPTGQTILLPQIHALHLKVTLVSL
jgi:hypothetical protein